MNTQKKYPFIVLGIIVFLVSLLLKQFTGIKTLELKTLDWRFELRGTLPVQDLPIVIVAIDDQSSESVPARWPWPRSYYAHAAENLLKAGAKIVAMDMVIDQPDPNGKKSDSLLAEVLKKYPDKIILAGKVEIQSGIRNTTQIYYVPPMELFTNTGILWGAVAIAPDIDGFYRKYLFAQYIPDRDTLFPSFAAQILKSYLKIPANSPFIYKNNYLMLDSLSIPTFSPYNTDMLINFIGPAHSFQYIPFDNVIDDSLFALRDDFDIDYFHILEQDSIFKDKIVLIGSSVAEHHDNFPTPFLSFKNNKGEKNIKEMPGVEIHANVLATVLTNNFIKHIPQSYIHLITILLMVLIISYTKMLKTLYSLLLSLFTVILYVTTVVILFDKNVYLEIIYPINTMVLSYFSVNIYLYIITKREKQMILGAFTHYVPPKVVNDIIADPTKLTLGGEEREISILFSDIANFTTISENIEPKILVNMINDYLTAMTDIILQHDGIIDKYEGDAIMAEFGAPVFFENHALQAAKAALKMQRTLTKLKPEWEEKGYPELYTRIGINTGNVIIGNMGSRDVFDYTAMGDNVNLAARLESANKMYGTKIMISEATVIKLQDEFCLRPLDMLKVKGKNKPVKVFELMCHKDDPEAEKFTKLCHIFRKGFQYYLERKWEQAIDCFDYTIKQNSEDPPSAIYLRRIHSFKKNPPPDNWDGVFTLSEK